MQQQHLLTRQQLIIQRTSPIDYQVIDLENKNKRASTEVTKGHTLEHFSDHRAAYVILVFVLVQHAL
jgi:hypothetical protein